MLNLISKSTLSVYIRPKLKKGVYTLYTLFIDPTRNPTRIECMLPPELYYENGMYVRL